MERQPDPPGVSLACRAQALARGGSSPPSRFCPAAAPARLGGRALRGEPARRARQPSDLSARLARGLYRGSLESMFTPPFLPTIVPRLLVLALLVVAGRARRRGGSGRCGGRSRRRLSRGVLVAARRRAARRGRAGRHARRRALASGAWRLECASGRHPAEIGRRYVDLLTDNLGQPGFREVLLAARSRRAPGPGRRAVAAGRAQRASRRTGDGSGPREAEIVDFTGRERDLVVDFLAGALAAAGGVRACTRAVPDRQLLARRDCIASATGPSWPCGWSRSGGRRRSSR